MSDATFPVRVATIHDREPVIALCRMCHDEVGLFSLSDPKMVAIVDYILGGGDGVIGVIGGKTIEASVCLKIGQPIYSDDLYLEEIWSFVHPDFRAPGRAKHLIQYAKRSANQLQLPLMSTLAVTAKTEAKSRLYARELSHGASIYLHRPDAMEDAA